MKPTVFCPYSDVFLHFPEMVRSINCNLKLSKVSFKVVTHTLLLFFPPTFLKTAVCDMIMLWTL